MIKISWHDCLHNSYLWLSKYVFVLNSFNYSLVSIHIKQLFKVNTYLLNHTWSYVDSNTNFFHKKNKTSAGHSSCSKNHFLSYIWFEYYTT
jgi:hypothetical protein